MSQPFRLVVCTPCRNHGHFLREAIDSIVTQSRLPDEYILIDNASTDDSLTIMREYAERFPWIRVIANTEPLSPMACYTDIIKGLPAETYFTSLAADDALSPGFYSEIQKLAALCPRVAILFGDLLLRDFDGGNRKRVGIPGLKPYVEITRDDYLRYVVSPFWLPSSNSGSTVYKVGPLRAVGGQEVAVDAWADTLVIHALALMDGAAYAPVPGVDMRISPETWSGRMNADPPRCLRAVAKGREVLARPAFARVPKEYAQLWKWRYRYAAVAVPMKKWLLAGRIQDALGLLKWLFVTPQGA